jgi:hypothetical protein
MTFDLEAAKRLAESLAGDVLNQIEREGSVNRENIAGQLLAGLVLEAGREKLKERAFERLAPSQIGGLQALVAEYPITGIDIVQHAMDAAIAEKRNEGMHRVVAGVAWNVGDKHVFCECPECKRRRNGRFGSTSEKGAPAMMTEKYRLMIYFAVATLHLYRKSVCDNPNDDMLVFKRKNTDVILRVCQEARGTFGYELSAEQMDRAIGAFRAPAQSIHETEAFELR